MAFPCARHLPVSIGHSWYAAGDQRPSIRGLDPNAVPDSRLWSCPNNGTKEGQATLSCAEQIDASKRVSLATSKVQ
jgi:hypothetical protein